MPLTAQTAHLLKVHGHLKPQTPHALAGTNNSTASAYEGLSFNTLKMNIIIKLLSTKDRDLQ